MRGADSAARSPISGLYFVTADRAEPGRTHAELARQAAQGGARVIQYREKDRSRSGAGGYVEAALAVRDVCREFGVTFIVNDDPELACEVGADGLHLGQDDLGDGGWPQTVLSGISVATLDEALDAVGRGADYLGVGPIFATPTKPDAVDPIGLEALREIRQAVDVPIAAIGGLCEDNVGDVMSAGADAVCIVSAIALAADPIRAARGLAKAADRATAAKALVTGCAAGSDGGAS